MSNSDARASWNSVSTDTVPPGQRLGYWRDTLRGLFPPTRVQHDRRDDFYGGISWREMGRVTISDIVSTSQEVTRSARDIKQSDEDCFEVNFQIEGEGTLNQDDRRVVTGPASFVLYDSRRPYSMRFDGPFRQMSLKMPRALLHDRLPNAETLTARHVSARSAPGRFVYDLVRSLRDDDEMMSNGLLAARLETHILDLLTTALCVLEERPPPVGTINHLAQRRRAKLHILSRLEDPALTPRGVATALGISLRQLYALFHGEDYSIEQWIQRQRLERVRRDLADPLQRAWPIGVIAFRWGFKDHSHFSRVFRARYDRSPSAYRNSCGD
jgi:AraC-like DNA-binding protein